MQSKDNIQHTRPQPLGDRVSFSFFFLSLVRGGLGVLDHGAGWMMCFSFPFFIHYISRFDKPDFVHFVFDGPLHCRKVGKRSRIHDCMQVPGYNHGITHTRSHSLRYLGVWLDSKLSWRVGHFLRTPPCTLERCIERESEVLVVLQNSVFQANEGVKSKKFGLCVTKFEG